MRIKISKIDHPQDFEKVTPNFIYNRYDLFCEKDEFEAVEIKSNGSTKVVEYRVMNQHAELGLWLTPITREELEKLISYIQKKHPNVKKITYKNGILSYGKARAHNHFRIVFPDTVEEMERCISSKSRSKMRKKLRFAEEDYGEMKYIEYDRSNLPLEIVEKFFEFKYEIRNRKYHMTALEYLDRYHVSDCYVLMFGDTVGAIRFACEQCPIVYGENFAYNPAMRDYSLGRAIFFHHLIRMVEKKHTELFFAGGDFEYKKHYGSIEETLYDCEIKVSKESTSKKIKRHLKKWIPSRVLTLFRKMKKASKSKG